MKKQLIIISLFILPLLSIAQQGVVNAYYVKALNAIILNGDTLRINNPQDGEVISRVNGIWKNTAGSGYSAVDSLVFDSLTGNIGWYVGGSISGYTSINGRYTLMSDSTKYVMKKDSGVIYYSTNQVDSLINKAAMRSVYEIQLASSSSVAGRIAAGVVYGEGTTEWILEPGISAIDLDITHNFNRRVAYVSIWAITGTQEQQLLNTAANNGLITLDNNKLRIQSLATIQKPIKIYIIFV